MAFHWFQCWAWLVSDIGMQKSEEKIKQTNQQKKILVSSFDFAWSSGEWFHHTLLPWNILVSHRALMSLTRDPKVDSHQHVALSWMRLLPRGQCYPAAAIPRLSPGFPEFFLDETYTYLLCHTRRLFSGQREFSARSCHKSTLMNHREVSAFILNSQQRKRGKSSVADGYQMPE